MRVFRSEMIVARLAICAILHAQELSMRTSENRTNRKPDPAPGSRQTLSSRITRLSLIHISLLTIVTFTIGNGLERVDVHDLKRDLDSAHYAAQALFGAYQNKQVDANGAGDPERDRLRDAWMKAFDKEQDIKKKYDTLLKEQFSISPSLLGSSLKIDLRSWVYCIPFVTLFAFLYIQILRKKQTVISMVGATRVNDDEVAKLDLLTFSRKSELGPAFERSSSRLEAAAHVVIVALLLTLIISDLDDTEVVLLGLQPLEIVEYSLMLFTAGCFAISYYYYESAALDLQATLIAREEIAQGLISRIWTKARSIARLGLSRLKPRMSLTTAALLVLASLFLSTAASCDGPRPGYTMLQDRGRWVTSIVNVKTDLYWKDAINSLGCAGYVIGLALAVLTLLVVACSIIRIKIQKEKTVHLFLFLATVTLSLMTIIDFSFSAFWFKDELFLVSNACWLIPSALLYWLAFSTKTTTRAGVRSLFIAMILPLFIVASAYASYSAWIGYRGVLGYFGGINIMSLGYLRMVISDRQKQSKTDN